MQTPIQKAIKICDDLLYDFEMQLRTDFERVQPKIDAVEIVRSKLNQLIDDEKEMIHLIYSNSEKIKTQ
jgi:hypothetical protein